MRKPALSFTTVRGRRTLAMEFGQEAERRGFADIFCPTDIEIDPIAQCQTILHATRTIIVGTSVQLIYFRVPGELASATRRFSLRVARRAASPSARFWSGI